MKVKKIIYSIPSNEYIAHIIEANYKIAPQKTILHKIGGGMLYYIYDGKNKYAFKLFSGYSLNDEIHAAAFRAEESFGVINHLYQSGFPAAKIYNTKSDKLSVPVPLADGVGIGALFEYVEGRDIEFNGNIKGLPKPRRRCIKQ